MPHISNELLSAFQRIAHDAAALAACVQRDDTGDIIGHQFVGNGNGGNLSQETLLAKDAVQRTLHALNNIKEG